MNDAFIVFSFLGRRGEDELEDGLGVVLALVVACMDASPFVLLLQLFNVV